MVVRGLQQQTGCLLVFYFERDCRFSFCASEMVYLSRSLGFWRTDVSFPMMYRGMFKMGASGPSAFSISFRFRMSA